MVEGEGVGERWCAEDEWVFQACAKVCRLGVPKVLSRGQRGREGRSGEGIVDGKSRKMH